MTILKADGNLYRVALKQPFGENAKTREFATISFIASPALGDLDQDGKFEVILPTAGANAALSMLKSYQRLDYEMHLTAWDLATGKMKSGFPQAIEDYVFFMNPLVVDIDGDGKKDVLAGSAGYFVHAWNVDGKEARGFPKLTGGWIAATPTVGDMDGDGKLELATVTRNGWLFVWHVRGLSKGRMDWDSFHHDLRNTGNLATPLDQGGDEIAPEDPVIHEVQPGDCQCQLGRRSPAPTTLAAVLVLLVLARLRRRARL
jgi:MYXO-CTERM domain-containing protein